MVTVATEDFQFFETLLDSVEASHPGSKQFYEKIIDAALTHASKQRDYGHDGDPFANVRASEDWGIAGWIGCMTRLCDKIKRLQTLAKKGELANESAADSFRDIMVYAGIAWVLFEETQAKPQDPTS